jgi:hypothetical protein
MNEASTYTALAFTIERAINEPFFNGLRTTNFLVKLAKY